MKRFFLQASLALLIAIALLTVISSLSDNAYAGALL